MKYNYIGKTGLRVSEICLGTMTFGGKDAGVWSNIGQLQQDEANEMIQVAVNAGINFFDTANAYSFGQSETILGQSIQDLNLKRNEIIIATKALAQMNDKPNSRGLSRYHLFNSVHESLQRLQLDYIDILYVHGVDPRVEVEQIVHTLNDIVNTGKVRYIAICNWPAWMVAKAQAIAKYNGWHQFIGLQYFYSAVTRDIEHELVPMAKDHQLAIFPWSPLAGGFLSGKFTRQNSSAGSRRDTFDFPPINKEKAYDLLEVFEKIGKRTNASPAQVALAWVRQQPGITSTIIGAKNKQQLQDNIASLNLELNSDDLAAIDAVSPLAMQYPGWMVQRQGENR